MVITFTGGHEHEIITQTFNVEEYKMQGHWDDGWVSLGYAEAVGDKTNEYDGLLY